MTSKAEIIENFVNSLRCENANQVSGDNFLLEVFGKHNPFSAVCNKCGSMNVEIIGERGVDYGGYTGYQPGDTVVKCLSCGNAVTAYE